jgi:hypothetical protein
MVRRHFDDIVAWTQTRQTNGFLEATNGLFQAAKQRRARGYASFTTMRTVLFVLSHSDNGVNGSRWHRTIWSRFRLIVVTFCIRHVIPGCLSVPVSMPVRQVCDV